LERAVEVVDVVEDGRGTSSTTSTDFYRPLPLFYLLPQPIQLLEAPPPPLPPRPLAAPPPHPHPPPRGQPLDLPETPGELVVRPGQHGLGIDAELAREIHDREQQIAYLFLNGREWGAGSGTLRR